MNRLPVYDGFFILYFKAKHGERQECVSVGFLDEDKPRQKME